MEQRELFEKEQEYIKSIHGGFSPEHSAGLAISGGGIRSASFALGAIQALCRFRLLERIHYLSTVSGGGYIGACLTWTADRLARGSAGDNHPKATGQKEKNPCNGLGRKGDGARLDGEANRLIDFLRQHSRYLTPRGFSAFSLAGVVLRSMFIGLVVYFPPLAALFALAAIGARLAGPWLPFQLPDGPAAACTVFFLAIAAAAAAGFVIISLGYALGTCLVRWLPSLAYRARRTSQKWLGFILLTAVVSLAAASIPKAVSWAGSLAAGMSVSAASLASSLTALYGAMRRTRANHSRGGAFETIAAPAAALVLIYALLAGAYLFAARIPGLVLPALALSLITGWLTDTNCVSLHRMYRDRLMELFMAEDRALKDNRWQPAREADTRPLASFRLGRHDGVKAPLHLINTNLILVDADEARFRGRGGDSFVLSPLCCGSDATGWVDTREFDGGAVTLATAMAVSGAAVNPHAGCSGRGPTRDRLVSFLMSFFNFRLGYWAANPATGKRKKRLRPNCFLPGAVMGLLGRGFKPQSRFIELSDGGHFENLAVYELIRRRVRTIIVTDGGADPEFNFADLANLVEKVRVDFGVEIEFPTSPAPIADLVPGSADKKSLYLEKYRLAKRGYAVGRIKYPHTESEEAAEGTIFYLKTTLTGGLPEDLYAYKSANPEFPDQSTSDQFFDETQFEAYRELGYRLAKKMIRETGVLTGSGKGG